MEPPHVARRQFAAGTYGLLHWHHRLGISHYASMLVGWCSAAEIVSCGQGAIRRCAARRRDCADDEPADVVGGSRKYGMGRKRHSECLPLSVWCFWLWCNASQLPISPESRTSCFGPMNLG